MWSGPIALIEKCLAWREEVRRGKKILEESLKSSFSLSLQLCATMYII